MKQKELNELLEIPMETRMDAEKVLFALEQEPDGFNTTTWRIASSVLGDTHDDETNYLFTLDSAIRILAENHGILIDDLHHAGKIEGLPFNLDYYVWHRENAAENGKFNSKPENRDYHYELDEIVAEEIGRILEKALPSYAVPAELAFCCRDIPALDAELVDISCSFIFRNLYFGLGFTLNTGRHSRYVFGLDPEPTVEAVDLTCENNDPDVAPFESTWDPATNKWSEPLPFD